MDTQIYLFILSKTCIFYEYMRKQTPFTTNPDPSKLFLTPGLKAVLHKCEFVIEERQGLTAIQGDVGLGKSSLLRYLSQSYSSREDCTTAYIHTPTYISELAFLKAICGEFGVEAKGSRIKYESAFNNFLIKEYEADRLVVLFIDEAQKLPGAQLELLRTLLNFELPDAKLIQIVIAAQLELRERLAHPTKKALRSRIFAPSLLDALSPEETEQMIQFRCDVAGVPNPFTPEVVQAIYTATGGVPREILKTCAIGFDVTKQLELTEITPEMVEGIYKEASNV